MAEQTDHPTSQKELQDLVCQRLTRDGVLDSLRRKMVDRMKHDATLNARLQTLLASRASADDVAGLEGQPRGARRAVVERVKADVLNELRADAHAFWWALLVGDDSGSGGGDGNGGGGGGDGDGNGGGGGSNHPNNDSSSGGGGGNDIADEIKLRAHEALCAIAEDDWRARVRAARSEQRAAKRRAAAAAAAGARPHEHGGPRKQPRASQD